MLVLGIESTCDETAVAIVRDGKEVLSNIIASQIKDHQPWNGVVPEIASRLHLKKIIPLTEEACKTAGVELKDVDLIASSNRPGLIGGLIIGTAVAKFIQSTTGQTLFKAPEFYFTSDLTFLTKAAEF